VYGNLPPADPKGQVGAGLGMSTSAGTVSLISPTDHVTETGQRMTIAGLDFEFILAPDSEAPAEMHWFIEQFAAVTAAENCCHTLHNTYSIRGTKIRDPLAWSKYLEQTIELWGDRVEVMYGMHHWPAWGRERVLELLGLARDGYRFINDETLRLANHGHTPSEIAEQVEFPPKLSRHWAMRGYYGTLNHINEAWTVMVRSGALSHRAGEADEADVSVTIARADLNGVILGTAQLTDQIADGRAKLTGDERVLHDFVGLLDDFEFWFNIVTP
jgi:alkyl sulfatase BDS1-like metallo-beta-lactamase superfamily hydrolase